MENPEVVTGENESSYFDLFTWYYGLASLLFYGLVYVVEVKLGKYNKIIKK